MNEQEVVARGVELLDQHMPGWELKIDLGALQMDDCESCMLGQLMGHYVEGLNRLGIYDMWVEDEKLTFSPVDYTNTPACAWFGFESDVDDPRYNHHQYEALEREWTRVVKERLDRGVDLRS